MDRIVFEKDNNGYQGINLEVDSFLKENNVDGVICTTRTYMEIVYELLKRKHVRMPDEVSLVGYDDPFWTSLVDPPITVISEDRQLMGEKAVDLLFDRIENTHTGEPRKIVLNTNFVVRTT